MASISIRRAVEADHNYIRSNFALSYTHSAYAAGASLAVLRALIEPLLALWTCNVAVPASDPDFVIGWILFRDPKTVAWIHVRPGLPRRKGIATQLLAHAGVVKGTVVAPFLPTRLEGHNGSFTNLASEHGFSIRFRPYLPCEEALGLAAIA